jgi:hypothetical protein
MYSPETIGELLEMRGSLLIELRDENGNIKDERLLENLVVSAGKTFIASRMVGVSAAVMSHMAVGTNNTAPAAGDTTLAAEVAASRTALGSATSSGAVATYTCTFGAGVGTGALVEAGIFNASSAGTMLCRTTFSTINKASGDSLTVTWTVTVG